ncbi:antibiotic biosynthesis monooxygenase family protein [Listeria booriae]|uniref:Antibiotic biosynthesis monooxygenase n=1 Tax=Listeria booriae TaxID=1552123 RepID=A0A7X0ZNY4_9LIST|nr:antibiotic biosynthesis monooxygenase [Listeria booriae]MBC2283402.1 antibiotic biosynthesis monooxygenase [Listeria booriae]MBC2293525.1 antibiotic biosynthesis monooxygenase [Listeria booriae]MBC2304719.1 antibiotic biosynthesis monooxygenase [Listeria booriae]
MKYAYITSGTEHFLRQILAEHPTRNITLLQNFGDSILLEETEESTVFKEGSAYRINHSYGEIKGHGTVTFEYLHLRSEEVPIFQKLYQSISLKLHEAPGLQCTQLLQSRTESKYLILTFWDSGDAYQHWKNGTEHNKILDLIRHNSSQSGFSHVDVYHFPEYFHDEK